MILSNDTLSFCPSRSVALNETHTRGCNTLNDPSVHNKRGKHPCSKRDFFCILLCSVLHPYLFLCPDSPAFCLLLTTHNTDIPAPGGIYFVLS